MKARAQARGAVAALAFLVLALTLGCALGDRGAGGFAPAGSQQDADGFTARTDALRIEWMRQWLATGGAGWNTAELLAKNRAERIDPWIRYMLATAEPLGAEREDMYRELLAEGVNDSLRHVISRDIATDLSFQSKQAQFIRRYGFYAAWFNRIAYTLTRSLQGNIQSVGQLAVDAAFDLFGGGDVTPAERKAYKLLRDLDAQSGRPGSGERKVARLERRVNRALAKVETGRGRWALERGDPELAEYYARGALQRNPEARDAKRLRSEAAARVALRRRRGLASAQVGYPDRDPPIEPTDPAFLRALFWGDSNDLSTYFLGAGGDDRGNLRTTDAAAQTSPPALNPGDAEVGILMMAMAGQGAASVIELSRRVRRLDDQSFLADPKGAWIHRLTLDPNSNPDFRLAQAERGHRGSIARFIFVGPDTQREQLYRLSSRAAQLWDALAGIGIFYGFEVIYRTGVVFWRPPPPADELLDAEVRYLRAGAEEPDAPKVARRLSKQYSRAGRFENARAVLRELDILDGKTAKKLDAKQARFLFKRAESAAPDDPRREPLLLAAIESAPESRWARRARKKLDEPIEPREALSFEVTWAAVSRWMDRPAPAGLPAAPEWFDGRRENGEVASDSVTLEISPFESDTIRVRYPIRLGGKIRFVDERMELEAQPERLGRWIRLLAAEQNLKQSARERPTRLPIPYEVVGGIGPSGMDLYPKLLTPEDGAGDLALYRD